MVTVEGLSETIAFVTLEQINDWLDQFGLRLTAVIPHNERGHATRGTAFFLTQSKNAPQCECAECAATGDPLTDEISELLNKD